MSSLNVVRDAEPLAYMLLDLFLDSDLLALGGFQIFRYEDRVIIHRQVWRKYLVVELFGFHGLRSPSI